LGFGVVGTAWGWVLAIIVMPFLAFYFLILVIMMKYTGRSIECFQHWHDFLRLASTFNELK